MRKKLVMVFTVSLILSLVLLAAPAYAVPSSEDAVRLSVLRYSPSPAQQGRVLDIWLQLDNTGIAVSDTSIKFIPEFPFALPEGQPSEIIISKIAAGETKIVKFNVLVAGDVSNGARNITFLFRPGTTTAWKESRFLISIETRNPAALVQSYTITPSPLAPGQEFNLTLTIKNAGKIDVYDLDVGVDLGDGTFNAVSNGAKKRITEIKSGGSQDISFTLISGPSTIVKLYNLPLSISFVDSAGKQYNQSSRVALALNAAHELDVHVSTTSFTKKTGPGTVSLQIVNKGVTDIKFLNVVLLEDDAYEILSASPEVYLGNLDSDDFEIVDFTIKPRMANPQLKLRLEFKDPYNTPLTKDFSVPVRIFSAQELGKSGSSASIFLIVVVVLAGAGYWWYRKKKAAHKR